MKILAIASTGGHWIQLLRLKPAFQDADVVFASTKSNFASTVKGYAFHSVPDASRWNKLQLIHAFFKIWKLISKTKPDVIITTGAAPGLMAIIVGKICNIKTVWIDSIANAEKLSMSGKLATYFSDKVYTQWLHLASDKVVFSGNIIR
jgi:UDP-N-acetylglucosamine:LPS N-acetylglucosamine transferase